MELFWESVRHDTFEHYGELFGGKNRSGRRFLDELRGRRSSTGRSERRPRSGEALEKVHERLEEVRQTTVDYERLSVGELSIKKSFTFVYGRLPRMASKDDFSYVGGSIIRYEG